VVLRGPWRDRRCTTAAVFEFKELDNDMAV